MSTNKPKSNLLLFNIDGFNESENYPSQKDLNILNIDSKILGTSTQGQNIRNIIENSNNLIDKIFKEAEEKDSEPIVNIQFDTNNNHLPDTEEALEKLKDLGLKVCCWFNHYNTENEELNNYWKPLLAKATQVFFVNAEDQRAAIDKGHVTTTNSTTIQSISTSLNALHAKVKELDREARISVVDVPLDKADVITDLIMTKFNIGGDNARDKENLKIGIRIEVDKIVQGKVNVPENLEKYISDISRQFKKDRINSNQEGIYQEKPIDIYLSLRPEGAQNPYNVQQKLQEIQQENTTRLEEVLKPMVAEPAIQNSILNAGTPVTSLERQGLKDPSYLYSDEDINTILNGSVDSTKFYVCGCFSLDQRGIDHSILTERSDKEILTAREKALLKESITRAIEYLKTGNKKAALWAIETGGGHWVGLVARRDENNNIEFIYNDPKGNSIELRPELVQIIQEIDPNAKIRDDSTQQQQNDKDCGPFVVDNSIRIATGKPILTAKESKGTMGAKLRAKQHEILQKHLEIPPAKREEKSTISMIEMLSQNGPGGTFSSKNSPSPQTPLTRVGRGTSIGR